MAIYRLSVTTLSRRDGPRKLGKTKQGQSAVAAASYRSGQELYSERDQEMKRARTSSEVIHSEIMAPDGAPEWTHDRERLWNEVEAKESRSDARVARDILISLPRELGHDQQVELVRGYVQEQFTSKGMVADVNIHSAQASDGGENPHAHIMLTPRGISSEGWDKYAGGGKSQPWNKKERVFEWREKWEEHANKALEENGSTARVDHRSLKERGIEQQPEPKLGPEVAALEERGIKTEKGDERRRVRAQRHAALLRHEWENRKQQSYWLRREEAAEQWKQSPKPVNMDWLDSQRSVHLEVSFNGQMPKEVRQRIEGMRMRQIQERETRLRAKEAREARREAAAAAAHQAETMTARYGRQGNKKFRPEHERGR